MHAEVKTALRENNSTLEVDLVLNKLLTGESFHTSYHISLPDWSCVWQRWPLRPSACLPASPACPPELEWSIQVALDLLSPK